MKAKMASGLVLIISIVTASGCASTQPKNVVFDFAEGSAKSLERRQVKHDRNLEAEGDVSLNGEDAAMGVTNVVLQSIVRLFTSDDD